MLVLSRIALAFFAASEPVTAPAPATSPSKPVEEVVVTGASRQGLRTEVDRRSYGIAGDLQTTAGSIGDALRNIPSVNVDLQGNVSLRATPTSPS